MRRWIFHKLTRLEELLERGVARVRHIENAWEVDSGFELEFEDGCKLRVLPVLEDGKPKLQFEVIERE